MKPACQRFPKKGADLKKRCQAALIDNTGRRVLIVYERSFPRTLRRWGFPKGKFKEGENARECILRETCEETGIIIEDTPHKFLLRGNNSLILFELPAEAIKLELGPEIKYARWVDINWLIDDAKNSVDKYNSHLRKFLPRVFRRLLKD